jgi:UDP-2-acetamido-3-amino-2,3-dideoxy-glucuronate N-acetyltransferase
MSEAVMTIHPSAEVEPGAAIGAGTRIWHNAQVRAGAQIGRDCTIGKNVYVDAGVRLGDRCKVQNNASLYHGLEVEAGVFIGPHVIFTNDRVPRAITPSGALKGAKDWSVGQTRVGYGASIGAGAVVTRDIPAYGLAVGNPAQLLCYVSAGGQRCESADEAATLSREEGYRL